MKIGLETESMHLWFQNKRMNILSYIDFAHDIGMQGIIINIIKDFGLNEWGTLGSDNLSHIMAIKERLDHYNMYCEIDSKGFEITRFKSIAKIAQILQANIIRSYVPLTDSNKQVKSAKDGAFDDSKITAIFDKQAFLQSAKEIQAITPLLEEYNLKLAIENHEYQTSQDLLDLLSIINHERVGILYDFGNSMMAYEDPIVACKNLAKYVFSTHCKDHIVIMHNNIAYVCGVPLGDGNIDIQACIKILKDSGLRHINIEQCYPYCATFKRKIGSGGIYNLGYGAFKIEKELFSDLEPMQYYYPQEISNMHLEKLLILQKEGCIKSAKYLRSLIQNLE